MDTNEQVKLRFKGVDFPQVQLNSIQPYVESEDNKVKVEIVPRFFFPNGPNNVFKIVIQVDVSAENYFNLRVIGVGTFELSIEDVNEEERKRFINANSTAIVFPYVRAFVSQITSNVGNVVTPIILPTRFF